MIYPYNTAISTLEPNQSTQINIPEIFNTQDEATIIKKIASLRANVCQIGKRTNKKFSIAKTQNHGIIELRRIA